MLNLSKLQGGTLVEYRDRSQFWTEGGRGIITNVVQDGDSVRIETNTGASFGTDLFSEWEYREHEGVTYLRPPSGFPSSSVPHCALAPEGVMIPKTNERKVNPMDLFS